MEDQDVAWIRNFSRKFLAKADGIRHARHAGRVNLDINKVVRTRYRSERSGRFSNLKSNKREHTRKFNLAILYGLSIASVPHIIRFIDQLRHLKELRTKNHVFIPCCLPLI